MTAPGNSRRSGRIAFAYPDFTYLQLARFCSVIGTEMQSVAVGWQVYEITNRALDLGLVGLAQFLPGILLFLVSGHAADRYNRCKVLTLSYGGLSVCSALLVGITLRGAHSVYPIYGVMLLVGIARSFSGPSGRALLPLAVPEEHFQNAVAWGSSIFQTATILGPAAGGFVYALFRGPAVVYGLAALATAGAALAMIRVNIKKSRPLKKASHGAPFSPACATSRSTKSCWARCHWTCSRSYSVARWRCFPCTQRKFSAPVLGG